MLKRSQNVAKSLAVILVVLGIARVVTYLASVRKRKPTRVRRGSEAYRSLPASGEIASARERMRSALLDGDVDAYVSFFADDCSAVVHSGERIAGAATIGVRTRNSLEAYPLFEIELKSEQTLATESQVLETGRYRFVIERDGQRVWVGGRFNAVWKRERDRWKIAFEAVRPES